MSLPDYIDSYGKIDRMVFLDATWFQVGIFSVFSHVIVMQSLLCDFNKLMSCRLVA